MARMVVGYVRQPHVALLALFIALRGTAYTATLPRNSVAKRRSYSGWLGLMVAVGFIVLAQPAAASANAVTVAVDGIAPSKTLAVSVQGEGGAAVTGTIGPGGEHLLVKGDVVLAPDCAPRVPGRIEVDCGPSADFAKVIFNGDDTANVMRARFAAPVPVEAHGNGGADWLEGSFFNDLLDGGADNDLVDGGPGGNDSLDGGAGVDRLFGGPGVDTLDGGAGADELNGGGDLGDTVDYSARTTPVIVEFPSPPFGVERGEGDTISGVNALLGGQAADDLSAPGGTPSQLRGGPGDDVLTGGTRDDIIAGEAGNDDITGGPGVDSLDGGPGDDFVDSFDGTADALVACGDGADDRLFADNTLDLSVASGCETVAPEFATAPSIAGDPRIGGVLSYAGAVISGSPSTLAFAWIRCRDAGLACDVIPGATGSAYSVGPADVGSALQLVVTATNAAGTDAAASSPTATVPALVPTAPSAAPPPSTLVAPPATVAPAPSPTPRVPARLRLAVVTVVGRPTVKLRRRAQRLDTGRRATCPPGPEPCRVDVVATVAPRGSEKTYRRTIAGRGSVTLAGGRSARLSFRLTKRAALLLRRTERLRLKLAITSRRGSSSSRTSRATISVRAPVARQ